MLKRRYKKNYTDINISLVTSQSCFVAYPAPLVRCLNRPLFLVGCMVQCCHNGCNVIEFLIGLTAICFTQYGYRFESKIICNFPQYFVCSFSGNWLVNPVTRLKQIFFIWFILNIFTHDSFQFLRHSY